jgi:hypothetical protein
MKQNVPSPHKLDDLCARQNFEANGSLLDNLKFNPDNAKSSSHHKSSSSSSSRKLVPFYKCLDGFIASQYASRDQQATSSSSSSSHPSSSSSLAIPSVLTHPPQTSTVADYSNAIRIQVFVYYMSIFNLNYYYYYYYYTIFKLKHVSRGGLVHFIFYSALFKSSFPF